MQCKWKMTRQKSIIQAPFRHIYIFLSTHIRLGYGVVSKDREKGSITGTI